MANIVVAFPNRVDEVTLSGGSWGSTLDNLKTRRYNQRAVSTNDATSSTKFDAALTKERPIRTIALINHNFSSAATIRIRVSLVSNFATTTYDTGVTPISVWYPQSTLAMSWSDPNWWSGTLDDEERALYPFHYYLVLPAGIRGQYIRVEITDTSNADNCIKIGRLFITDGWQPINNPAYGELSIQHETDSIISRTDGGAVYAEDMPLFRIARFNLGMLKEVESIGAAMEMERRLKNTGEVLYIQDPDKTAFIIQTSFPGRIRELSPIEWVMYGYNSKAFEIEELIA